MIARRSVLLISLVVSMLLTGCPVRLPEVSGLPPPDELPALPSLEELRDRLQDLPGLEELPDLGQLTLLDLGDLPPGALTYSGPISYGLNAGEAFPGTDIYFVGGDNEIAEFRIGDLRAPKRMGDSLDWDGTVVASVDVTLHQRLVHFSADHARTVGVVRVIVHDTQPLRAERTFDHDPPIAYRLPVAYNVRRDENIPGSLLRYAGYSDQGAEFGGLPAGEYPYRKVGDSISWQGRIRDNVHLTLDLRVLYVARSAVQVGGLATLRME